MPILLDDGALETRGAGLTTFCNMLYQELNTVTCTDDVSHLKKEVFGML